MIKAFISSIITLILLCISNESICQTITNVNSEQSGNTIEVAYTLSTTSPCEIALYVSLDGGTTWKGPLTKVQGAVGKNISAGEHTIAWQVLEELEELSSDNIKFKVLSIGKKPYEPEMVFVEGGSFFRGNSSSSAKKLRPEEYPEQLAYVSSFLISKSEVTQAQWRLVMGSNPSIFKGCDQCPVENVSFTDVENFITKINSLTGKNYRLPNEAEWELAARGGLENTTGHYFSDTNELSFITEGEDEYGIPIRFFVPHLSQGWFINNSESKTHKTGLKAANPIGLYDMGGNVAEWCSDWYSSYEHGISVNPLGPENGDKRVVRGGSFADKQIACRYASRKGYSPSTKTNKVGFRLALTVGQETDPSNTNKLQNQEFVINPIWSYFSVKYLTIKSEKEFLSVYSNPDSCKIIWNFAVANELTDLDQDEFFESFFANSGIESNKKRKIARLYFFKGMTQLALASESGSKQQVIESFTDGLKFDHNCAQLYYGRSLCYNYSGMYLNQEKLADLENAILYNENYISAIYDLSNEYYNRNKKKEALQVLAKVIELEPSDYKAYDKSATILETMQDFNGAITLITKGISNTDSKGYGYMRRAGIKKRSGDFRGAIADYSSAIDLDIGCYQYFNRAEAKYEIRDYIGSISDYTYYIGCNSDDASAFSGRGFAKFDFEDYSGAVADFTKSMELDKEKNHHHYLLLWRGHAYFNNAKYSSAIADYSRVIQMFSESNHWVIDAYYNRGLARVYSGAKESGCQDLRKAADLGNEDAIDAVRENCQ
jgi:formylglycine-generating enzyme required for sulfatase activity/tetratricopeptide (TPR) repeat protein